MTGDEGDRYWSTRRTAPLRRAWDRRSAPGPSRPDSVAWRKDSSFGLTDEALRASLARCVGEPGANLSEVLQPSVGWETQQGQVRSLPSRHWFVPRNPAVGSFSARVGGSEGVGGFWAVMRWPYPQ